ncbi:MAG: divalent-cation tolerance protein CutA [Thermoproteota archaeon]
MSKYIQVFTTMGNKEDALRIAKILLEKRLAACFQIIGPIKSLYWWKGKIEESEEWLCVIKSKEELYEELEKTIRENHPYEVPEIIAIPIAFGNKSYFEWINMELKRQ